MTPNSVEHAPVTHGQEQWWLQYLLQPHNAAHNIALPVRLLGPFNYTAFERAINELYRRHDVLRTAVTTHGNQPIQVVSPYAPRPLKVTDLRHLPPQEREDEAMRLTGEDARAPFRLDDETLFRVQIICLDDEDHFCLLNSHHAISDGWSLDLMLRELAAFYNAALHEENASLPAPAITHADFARRQRSEHQEQEAKIRSQIEYWREHLKGAEAALDLPTDRPRPAIRTHNGANYHFDLPIPLVAALKKRSQENGVTLFMTLLAAYAVWLHRHSGQTNLTIGSAIANRSSRDTRDLLGFLVNTVALRQDLAHDPTFQEMMHRERDEIIGAFQNADVPFRQLVEELQPERDPSQSPLFQAFLVSLPFIGDYEFSGIKKHLLRAPSNACLYDVLLQILTREHQRSDNLLLKLNYNTDLFDDETVQRMAARFVRLLESVAADPTLPISQLAMLPNGEREQIEAWSTGPIQDDQPVQKVEELVARQIAATPDATAIVDENGHQLTYRELGERSHILASHLRARGATPGQCVAIYLDRTLELPVAVLGTLQSGAAYVPLDISYPTARLQAILADAAPCALVTTRALVEQAGSFAAQLAQVLSIICIDELQSPVSGDDATGPAGDAEDPAYILYTSGSTGIPKGVVMPHRALVNLLHWQREQSTAHGNAAPRTLQFAPLGFDVSFQEIFSTLGTGGSLHLVSDSTRRDPFALLELLRKQQIERLFLPFVALQQLAFAAGRRNEYPLHLREVASAGEPLIITPEVRHLFAELPDCVLHNHYGPTETHVVTSLTLSGDRDAWPERPTIGRLITNARITVRDQNGEYVPIGVPGELVIEGTPVAHGYRQPTEATAGKFDRRDGRNIYRTGDIARWKNNGGLELLGRFDTQLKIRGYRVEPGEVEAALTAHPQVSEAAVIGEGQVDQEGAIASAKTQLLACIVAQEPQPTAAELRRLLREHLPEYMIPGDFLFVDRLPLTPSGKLDRAALAQLRPSHAQSAFVEPQTDMERLVARTWSEVLGVSPVGRYDDFFELGGHSLLGTLVVSHLRDELQIELPLSHLFEASSLEHFAARLETLAASPTRPAAVQFEEGRL